MIKNVKGTKDLLPQDSKRWRDIESVLHNFMELHGYGEIRTPAFEQTELFLRGIGKETDIVSKEMYSWIDQGGTHLTLKPELTAPVVRSYNQHTLKNISPITRLYYIDSLFRRERPQKGRLRQFHQFGVEAFGSENPEQDAEVIAMAHKIYEMFDIKDLSVKINTIGSPEVRENYLLILRESMENHVDELCSTCQTRLGKNALRLFDCKNNKCQEVLDEYAPKISDHISDEDKLHFESVLSLLDTMQIPYIHDKKLVRGLDYYTRTTFEITSTALGSQDALCGGGRYDKLVEELGGKPTPAIGFASGIERLMMVLGEDEEPSQIDVFMVILGENAIAPSLKLADSLRKEKGIAVMVETLRRSMKAQMKEANRQNAQFVIIIGDNELEKGKAVVKVMESGEQMEIPFDEIISHFQTDEEHSHND